MCTSGCRGRSSQSETRQVGILVHTGPERGFGMAHELILGFREVGPELLPLVGGKGANLGVLTRAGLPVPQGFCVTTEAYGRIAAQVAVADPQADPARMRAAILNAAIPDEIAGAIRAALSDLR